MTSLVRVVTVAGTPALEASLAEKIHSDERFVLLLRCVDRSELLGAIRGGSLDVVVSCGLPQWVDPQVVDEARGRGIRVVVVGDDHPDRDRIVRLGLRHVALGEPDAILRALDATGPPPPRAPLPEPTGRLVAVWGPKGAPGRTSIALELASHIARVEASTVLVDGDPYGGDLVQLAGVVEEVPTVVWAARMAAKEELDADALRAQLRRVGRRGPVLLPGLPRPDLWPEVSEFGWRRLIGELRAGFEYTLCDTGFCFEPDPSPYPEAGDGRNRIARVTLAEADRIVAVCRADPVGIKQFVWGIDALRELVDLDKVIVVLNRARHGERSELGKILERHTGKRPTACVPERVADWEKAVSAGVSVHELKPGSDVSKALDPVAGLLGLEVPGRGALTRLAGRR